MRSMKDSGVEWIGKIPEDWEVRRLKNVLKERKESNKPIKTDFILSLTANEGVIPYTEKKSGGNKSKEDLSDYKLAYPGDIVVNNMNVISGSVGLSEYFGCLSPVYYTLYPISKLDNVKYFNYVFQSSVFQKSLRGLGNGIMMKESQNGKLNTVRMRISMDKLNTVLLPVPDSSTQETIANYLDIKVKKIDNIISKTKETIEEYKKYKQSVITEAVTKGLNPNVEMKDSGIEWIGEIPKHWKTVKLKNIGTCFGGVTYSPENITDEINGRLVLRSSNVQDGKLSFDDNVYINLDINEKYIVKKGDILVCSRNGSRNLIGKNAIIENNYDYTFGAFMTIVRTKNYNYVYYFLNSDIFKSQSSLYLTSTINQLTLGVFNNFKLCLPSEEEQKHIVTYLDKKCGEIDKLISKKQNLITELEEYKKSLIYECVTGKKEVSQAYAY